MHLYAQCVDAVNQRAGGGEFGGDVETIHVVSGGDGPTVEIVNRRGGSLPAPEAAADPDEGSKK